MQKKNAKAEMSFPFIGGISEHFTTFVQGNPKKLTISTLKETSGINGNGSDTKEETLWIGTGNRSASICINLHRPLSRENKRPHSRIRSLFTHSSRPIYLRWPIKPIISNQSWSGQFIKAKPQQLNSNQPLEFHRNSQKCAARQIQIRNYGIITTKSIQKWGKSSKKLEELDLKIKSPKFVFFLNTKTDRMRAKKSSEKAKLLTEKLGWNTTEMKLNGQTKKKRNKRSNETNDSQRIDNSMVGGRRFWR